MNLHSIASSLIGAVNPPQQVVVKLSTGSSIDPSGRQVPSYAPDLIITAQVQSLTAKDIRQVERLNLQNVQNTIYLNGQLNAIVRSLNKGGDLVVLGDGTVYLVVAVLEQWPDWVKVAVTLQDQLGVTDITPPTIGADPQDLSLPSIASVPFNWSPPTIRTP